MFVNCRVLYACCCDSGVSPELDKGGSNSGNSFPTKDNKTNYYSETMPLNCWNLSFSDTLPPNHPSDFPADNWRKGLYQLSWF